MRVVIIGAGEVGFHVAKSLSELDYDIAVIDTDPVKCQRANEHLDVIVIEGNGSDAQVLKNANVDDADYVFCVTSSDETNLIASMQSHNLGAKKIVARLRNTDYSNNGDSIHPEKFGVDVIIHPEHEVANEIVRLVKHPYAEKFYEFENGKAVLFSKKINHRSKLVNDTVEDFHRKNNDDFKSLIVAVVRDEKMTIPPASFKFEPDDNIFFFVKSKNLNPLLSSIGVSVSSSKRVMIAGASKIGRRVAEELQETMSVRLVDNSKEKAKNVANELGDSIVMNADATDVEFLKNENIGDVDSFISVTEDQQLNLLAGILAKQLRVKQSIIHVANPDYVKSMSDLGIGSIVSKNTSSVNSIVKAIRIDQKDNVIQIFSRLGMEAIELEVERNSKGARVPIANLNLPHGSLIALVNHNGHIAIPSGDYQILPNDAVLIFCINSKVKEVTNIFKSE